MLAVVVIWGANLTIIKAALAELSPFAFNAIRCTLAALLLLLAGRMVGGAGSIARRALPRVVLLGVLGHAAYQNLFIAGLHRTTVTNSSLILATVPLFVGGIGWLLRVERPTRRMWAGLVAAFSGLAVLTHSQGGAAFQTTTALGDLLTLIAILCWAAYTVLGRPLLTQGMSPLHLTTATLLVGQPLVLAAGVPDLVGLDWAQISQAAWGALTFSAALAIVVSYVIWYASVQVVGGARTAVIANLVPVVAMLSAWVWLGEPIGRAQITGAAVVLFGIWLAETGRPENGV